jgi:hypothetical protein
MDEIERVANNITVRHFGPKAVKISRFTTGLSHYVYDVSVNNGISCVLRVARPKRHSEFNRGMYWHSKIENLGLPLPEMFATGVSKGHPYALYQRLEGDDLENVYSSLSFQALKEIAWTLTGFQVKVAKLGIKHFERTYPWIEVLEAIVNRSECEILSHKLCSPEYIPKVRARLTSYETYFATLKPKAFLYDLNVRNIIINGEKVSGIIDVDDVWYGDPLLAVGRGKTILLAMRQNTILIDHWCKFLKLSSLQLDIVDFYALLYCLRFMGTIGTKLNGNPSIQTDPNNARLFEHLVDHFLEAKELSL